MAIALFVNNEFAALDENGDTVADAFVYFYEPGTTTLKSAYADAALNTALANPKQCDGNGKLKAFLNGEYRIKVFKADDSTLVRDTDNINKGAAVITGNFNLADNGSFETDSTGDGTPDNVVLTPYTSGTVARDATDGTDGGACLKFSDGGNGGGYAVGENFFGVSVNRDIEALFELKSSAANVRNLFEIIWYDKDQTELSTSTVFDDAATNPTGWEPRGKRLTPPASATYAKWRFYGCHSSAASDGKITRLDNVIVRLAIGQTWEKGADLASATALVIGHDGNYFDVTGTTTITSFAGKGAGSLIKLQFDAALILTYHATDLILPTGANITTAAGDVAEFYEYAADDYICTSYLTADGKQLAAIALADLPAGAVSDLQTETVTTSGTEHDYTSIPSWAKRITIMFDGISINGTAIVLVQLGDSGGIETTGYEATAKANSAFASTAGFLLSEVTSAATVYHGSMVLTLEDDTNNVWTCHGVVHFANTAGVGYFGGSKALTAALDRIRLTTSNGSDTFDAGAFNIMWE